MKTWQILGLLCLFQITTNVLMAEELMLLASGSLDSVIFGKQTKAVAKKNYSYHSLNRAFLQCSKSVNPRSSCAIEDLAKAMQDKGFPVEAYGEPKLGKKSWNPFLIPLDR